MVYNLIIIGGGPAGITAGIYAARQKLKTLLITKSFGGQMARKAVAIENYPGFEEISGQDLIKRFEKHLRNYDINVEKDEVAKITKNKEGFLISTEGEKQFQSKTVIVASGADPRPLEVPGEKELIGRGVSYCSVCDGPLFRGKTVAVIGGGNAGFEAAIFLSKIAKKIYILEYNPEVIADTANQERAKKTGKIEVITSASLKQIKGQKFVDSIIYQDLTSKEFRTLEVEGVFIEIGSVPATGFVKGLVDFNEKDEIKIDSKMLSTKTSGLFAAGDVTEVEVKQIVVAAGEGAKAALNAYKYFQG